MKKEHLPIIIAISLPILFIVAIALIVFLPSLSIKPAHNFIYTNENQNNPYYAYNGAYKNTYDLKDGKVYVKSVHYTGDTSGYSMRDYPSLYLYDVKLDTSRQISLEEANQFNLEPGPSSPDGYTVQYKYDHDGIFELFGSNGDGRGYFISKGNASKKITALNNGDRYYSDQFRLIGWVK